METQFTDADVSNFIKQLIELGGINSVDDSPDKYIRRISTGDIETITCDGKRSPLAIYGTKASDAIVINPLAEGCADGTKNLWFYSTRNMIASGKIIEVLLYLISVGAKSKKKDGDDIRDLAAAKYLSKQVVDIDDKTPNEFQQIAADVADFFTIYYNKTTRCGEVKCILFSEVQRKKFKDVRQKTWRALEQIFLRMMDVTALNDFDFKATSSSVPVFDSFANILVNVYTKLKEPLEMLGQKVEHLSELRSHLKYVQEYFFKAKWCVSPSTVTQENVPVPWGMVPNMPGMPGVGMPIPGQMPLPTNGMPIPMQMPLPGYGQLPAPIYPMPQASAIPPNMPIPGQQQIATCTPSGCPLPMPTPGVTGMAVAYDYAAASGSPFCGKK